MNTFSPNYVIQHVNTRVLLFLIISSILFFLSFIIRPTGVFAYIGMTTFISFAVFILYIDIKFFVLFYMFFFSAVGSILGCALIENNFYILEQLQYGSPTGGTVRLVFYYILFLSASFYFYSFISSSCARFRFISSSQVKRWEIIVAVMFTFVIVLYILAFTFKYGSPLTKGIDRFEYWKDIVPSGVKKAAGLSIQASFLNGVLFSRTKIKSLKTVFILCFTSLIFVQILQGVKFSGLHLSLYLFLFPSLLNEKNSNSSLKLLIRKYLVYGLLFLILSMSLVIFQYKTLYGRNPFELTALRIVLQGHVWWGTDDIVRNKLGHLSNISIHNELTPFPNSHNSYGRGLQFLMWLVSPKRIVDAYLEKGVFFSMGYPAIIIYYFGYISTILIQIIVAVITSFIMIYFFLKCHFSNILISLIAVRLFMVIIDAFCMGNLFNLFDYRMLIYCISLLAYESVLYLTSYLKLSSKTI